MCDICDHMLREEHEPEAMAFAKKFPCPRCKIFAASGDLEPRGKRRPKPQPCSHCYIQESGLHGHCTYCNAARIQ
jgi:hypothetical protein